MQVECKFCYVYKIDGISKEWDVSEKERQGKDTMIDVEGPRNSGSSMSPWLRGPLFSALSLLPIFSSLWKGGIHSIFKEFWPKNCHSATEPSTSCCFFCTQPTSVALALHATPRVVLQVGGME